MARLSFLKKLVAAIDPRRGKCRKATIWFLCEGEMRSVSVARYCTQGDDGSSIHWELRPYLIVTGPQEDAAGNELVQTVTEIPLRAVREIELCKWDHTGLDPDDDVLKLQKHPANPIRWLRDHRSYLRQCQEVPQPRKEVPPKTRRW
jgi:hypothetical protein